MGQRLSFGSSPESDYDVAAGCNDDAVDRDVVSRRPTRAASDPSIAAVDDIPRRPVEPPPAPPRSEIIHPHPAYDSRYVCTSQSARVLLVLVFLCLLHFIVVEFCRRL